MDSSFVFKEQLQRLLLCDSLKNAHTVLTSFTSHFTEQILFMKGHG